MKRERPRVKREKLHEERERPREEQEKLHEERERPHMKRERPRVKRERPRVKRDKPRIQKDDEVHNFVVFGRAKNHLSHQCAYSFYHLSETTALWQKEIGFVKHFSNLRTAFTRKEQNKKRLTAFSGKILRGCINE